MRLPRSLLESPFFLFSSVEELLTALGTDDVHEKEKILSLASKGLPPIVSAQSLAVMLGINTGIVWSFANRTHKYYRTFEIPKGRSVRRIQAPKVGLKIIQTWVSFHIARVFKPPPHVHGFVPGRSHIQAAKVHVGADWALSVDIKDFFPSIPYLLVREAFQLLGYELAAAELLTNLSCLHARLPQGAPTSPPLSNICFATMDLKLLELARRQEAKLTRYADDIVFSGNGSFPLALRDEVRSLFTLSPWTLSPEKERLEPVKGRIKVHGLLVSGGHVRLTKGYRNRIRAYRHIMRTKRISEPELARLRGHIGFADQVQQVSQPLPAEEASFVSLRDQAQSDVLRLTRDDTPQPRQSRLKQLFQWAKRLLRSLNNRTGPRSF